MLARGESPSVTTIVDCDQSAIFRRKGQPLIHRATHVDSPVLGVDNRFECIPPSAWRVRYTRKSDCGGVIITRHVEFDLHTPYCKDRKNICVAFSRESEDQVLYVESFRRAAIPPRRPGISVYNARMSRYVKGCILTFFPLTKCRRSKMSNSSPL